MTRWAVVGFVVATAVWMGDKPAARHEVRVHRESRAQDRWTWSGAVAAGRTIEIRGINGSISAEAATGNQVEVTADKRARRSDPDEVRIEVIEHGEGVTICAVYPGRSNACRPGGSSMNTRNNDVSVEFNVRVPRGVLFDGNTVNGDVEVSRLSAGVSANTVNGSVRLETDAGDASAHTVNGSVTAILHSLGDRNLSFETVNGAVNLSMPRGANLDLEAGTVNGTINTAFAVQVQGRLTRRQMNGRIGTGGRTLRIRTVNGSINLRELAGM